MTVETFTDTAPDELNVSLPASGDSRTEGDNHLRNIKNVIKTTFANVSGPVTSSEAELNYVDISALGTWQAGKALTAAATTGAISCANLAMTNINIDSGDITGVSYAGGTVTGSLTWNAAQNLNSQALTNVNIDSGNIASAVVLADGIAATTQSAGDNSTALATTAYVDALTTVTKSIATNGYIKLGSIYIQWLTMTPTTQSTTASWPIAFPTACLGAVASFKDVALAGTNTHCGVTWSATQYTVTRGADNTSAICVIAIGH